MRVREWPNKLGWTVGCHDVQLDREVGLARVLVYRGGKLWKVSTPVIEQMLLGLPTTPERLVNVVRFTKRFGRCADDDCACEKCTRRRRTARSETVAS